jgi:hypothetical protein
MTTDIIIHTLRREGVIAEAHGMLLSVWRSAFTIDTLRDARHAMETMSRKRPEGAGNLAVFRFDPADLRALAHEHVRRELIALMRATDKMPLFTANVFDSPSLVTAALRSAAATIQLVARSRKGMRMFLRTEEALGWLLPLLPGSGGINAMRDIISTIEKLDADLMTLREP